jgi:catechol 2,3-dioxygenase-like lactoylglutathione lyase family enzyme
MKRLCAVIMALGIVAQATGQQTPSGRIQSLSHAIHAVDDLDTTLGFYREVFGIDGRGQDFANPAVPLLTNAPGVTLRMAMVGLPGGTRFEFTHFKGLERAAGQARYTDPGAASLVLKVRDIDTLVAAARRAGADFVTTGGEPVQISTSDGSARSIVFRDPDGFFVQLIEQPAPAGAADGNIHGVSLAYTMEDASATRAFYAGMLGVDLSGADSFARNPALARLFGAPEDVELRQLTGTLPPGTAITFTEFRGTPRTKFHLRVRDPGAPALAVQVENIEGMLAQMEAAGVNVISEDGKLVDFGNGIFNIFVEDPNGMNIELFERGL